MGEYYDGIEPDLYDEFIVIINFIAEPYAIAEVFTEMSLPKESKVFDVGCGTGLMGKLLNKNDYKNIVGVDASQKFVDASV